MICCPESTNSHKRLSVTHLHDVITFAWHQWSACWMIHTAMHQRDGSAYVMLGHVWITALINGVERCCCESQFGCNTSSCRIDFRKPWDDLKQSNHRFMLHKYAVEGSSKTHAATSTRKSWRKHERAYARIFCVSHMWWWWCRHLMWWRNSSIHRCKYSFPSTRTESQRETKVNNDFNMIANQINSHLHVFAWVCACLYVCGKDSLCLRMFGQTAGLAWLALGPILTCPASITLNQQLIPLRHLL